MKKIIKLTALALIAVMILGVACGCVATSDKGTDEKVYAELTIGLPYDEKSDNWSAVKAMVKDFEEMDDAKVTLVTVPEVGTEEYTKFLKNVKDGKVDLFLSPSNSELFEIVQDGFAATVTAMNAKDNNVTGNLISAFKATSREDDRGNYAVPFHGVYQGLYLNKDVFEKAGVALPTDWATLNAAIPALKAKGITPFAAGFADGSALWLDELILSEGGVAEHSATPSKGVITSWSRAVKDIKNFYNAGAFSATALTDTQSDAVSAFINKEAAMIICTSSDLGAAEDDQVAFMSFPKAPGGLKKDGSYIAEFSDGFYFNKKTFNRNVDDTTTFAGVMIDFINSFMGSYDYYPDLFNVDGTFCYLKDGSDETMDTATEQTAWTVLKATVDADLPMKHYMITFDDFAAGLGGVLDGSVKADDYLLDVTDKELAAQAEKLAAEKEKNK